jgi:hypothetical protein
MPGKRIQIDDESWSQLRLMAHERMMTFQELADEAFADLLKSTAIRSTFVLRCAKALVRAPKLCHSTVRPSQSLPANPPPRLE